MRLYLITIVFIVLRKTSVQSQFVCSAHGAVPCYSKHECACTGTVCSASIIHVHVRAQVDQSIVMNPNLSVHTSFILCVCVRPCGYRISSDGAYFAVAGR